MSQEIKVTIIRSQKEGNPRNISIMLSGIISVYWREKIWICFCHVYFKSLMFTSTPDGRNYLQ